eukprot:CAMPEP_0171010554 /NCGR_PEP_ID=MMETSP0736-20130129/22159_1 /TAXON_ID=186038 /ORGANISM="Fragilariopsis kerguelensis, Strain L26-C5" /LENGTH=51 /DNA_ID=CAMNT_0011442727 /DNA_START=141 /DNA_END=293 /DNA_ORIENTATION=-
MIKLHFCCSITAAGANGDDNDNAGDDAGADADADADVAIKVVEGSILLHVG